MVDLASLAKALLWSRSHCARWSTYVNKSLAYLLQSLARWRHNSTPERKENEKQTWKLLPFSNTPVSWPTVRVSYVLDNAAESVQLRVLGAMAQLKTVVASGRQELSAWWLQWSIFGIEVKVKVKSSMARSLPVENLLAQKVGSIINYFQ